MNVFAGAGYSVGYNLMYGNPHGGPEDKMDPGFRVPVVVS